MIELKLQTNITQSLEMLLSPRMLQMLKVLSLPYHELVDRISREEEENVMLEVERRDEYVEFIRYLNSDKKIKKEADFSEYPGLENISQMDKTLEQYLLDQLESEDVDELYREIGKNIIGNIDDHGYLLAYPALREQLMQQFDVSRPTVDKILHIIQGFEPDGVGARDIKECLLLQVKAYDFDNQELEELLTKVIDQHLADLENEDYQAIAGSLGIPLSGVTEIANFIKNNLTPYPGSTFGGETRQIIPSFAIEKTNKGFQLISLENRYGPVLKLSPLYLKMLDDPKTDQQTVTFLKDKFKKAKELIEDFSKRTETLEKIVRKIIETQSDFLEKGAVFLKPLSQKSLAEEFGLHPSTISRTVSEKYIQTPHGAFALKFLCPRGPKGITAARLKSMIVGILKSENKSEPLTDEQLTQKMLEQGADIDRRTIAYYRKELKIPTASQRQEG